MQSLKVKEQYMNASIFILLVNFQVFVTPRFLFCGNQVQMGLRVLQVVDPCTRVQLCSQWHVADHRNL